MAVLLHVDMDAFFASVELLLHPEWRGKPLIVGAGPHERGVVSTCSYEARRYGVHSAMPSREAYRLCPHAVFTHPHMEAYRAVSAKAFEIFGRFTPFVEGVSIDEAFLDATGSLHRFPGGDDARRATAMAESLRNSIRAECGVTCSVGIAKNRLLAKIGSDLHKPDGLTLMPFDADEVAAFLRERPVGMLWGVGKKTVENLARYGIRLCGDIQRLGRGNALVGDDLVDMASGIADDKVYYQEREAKSISREWTFDADEPRRDVVRRRLMDLADDVGRLLRREEKRWAKTAKLKLRDAAFTTVLRQTKFEHASRDIKALRTAAAALFDAAWPRGAAVASGAGLKGAIRLVGFGVADFTASPDCAPPSLFGNPENEKRERNEHLSAAIDALRDKGYSIG